MSSGFELITEEETFAKDKELIFRQMRGLFESQPITIEEKGYLIQLMHNRQMRSYITEILQEIN